MLLALDVATSTCTIALFDPASDSLLAERVWRTRRRQTEETLPAVAEMLARAGQGVDAIRIIAVTTGPGSFTGVRIGISMVKGIALGLPEPPRLIGLPVLSVTAARFARLAAGAVVWPLLQAGRGRFNWAIAPMDDPLWLPPAAEHRAGQVDALVEALQAERRPVWLVGDGIKAPAPVGRDGDALRQAAQRLPHVHCIDPAADIDLAGWLDKTDMPRTRGDGLARLAVRHWRAGSPALTESLQPLYLQGSF